MSSNDLQFTKQEQQKTTNKVTTADVHDDSKASKPKFTYKKFLKKNGLTISLFLFSTLIMVVGLILYYQVENIITSKTGFWMIFSGVILFLVTIIFGFERINL